MRKLDETRYKLNSELEETEKLEDTDIVPAGTVSKVHIACFFLNCALITEILTDIFYQCNIKKSCYFSYDNVIISDLWTWSI